MADARSAAGGAVRRARAGHSAGGGARRRRAAVRAGALRAAGRRACPPLYVEEALWACWRARRPLVKRERARADLPRPAASRGRAGRTRPSRSVGAHARRAELTRERPVPRSGSWSRPSSSRRAWSRAQRRRRPSARRATAEGADRAARARALGDRRRRFPHVSPLPAARRGLRRPAGPRACPTSASSSAARPARRARRELSGRPRGAPSTSAARASSSSGCKLEPGRYRFARLPVSDLGAGRLRGLGGPPPPRPDRHARRLVAAQALVRLSVTQGVALHARPRLGGAEHLGQRAALALGHRADRLLLGHRDLREELAAAGLSPAALAHQQVGDGHALGLPRAFEDHLGDVELAGGDAPLELGAGEAHLVGAFAARACTEGRQGQSSLSRSCLHLPVAAAGSAAQHPCSILTSARARDVRSGSHRGRRPSGTPATLWHG